MTEEQVFLAVLDLADPAERADYLKKACGGDVEFRSQVEQLLAAHFNTGEFLNVPVGIPLGADPATPFDGDPALLQTDRERDEMAAEKNPDEEADDLNFLQPATRPNSLGRIGHYEVLELLGKGGFGIVFRAFDDVLERVVALKVLAPAIASTSPARKRFLREARASAQVRHDNVVQVYAVEEQPLPYLVMEFIPGETLQQRLDRTGPLEAREVVEIGLQIAEGLAAAHATRLIHRDIKPANMLIEAGPRQRVKITDFGLARAADDASLTRSGMLAGTPLYMAPEQAKGETLDHRADLFSLGSVLYTMATGRPPFRAPTTLAVLKRVVENDPRPIQEVIPEVPTWLCEIIARLQAKKPDDRFANARDVADLLGRRLAALQHPENAEAPQVPAPAIRRPRIRIGRRAAVVAVFLILLVGLGFTEAAGVTNFHGTVIRLISPEGTLVVEVDDPGVNVQIDGANLVITGAGNSEIRLKPGSHTIEASKDGAIVSRELVTVTKNGKQIVRIGQEAGVGPQIPASNRRAAEYVLSIGGGVWANDHGREIKAVTDLPRDSFRLTGISLADNKQVTDAGLAVFKGLHDLHGVTLSNTKVSDAGLVYFQNCRDLTGLHLGWTRVSDAGLALFKDFKHLDSLELAGKQISDAGLAHFKDRKGLQAIGLADSQISDEGLAHLRDCQNMRVAWLRNTKVSDAGLAIFQNCRNLSVLDVSLTRVSDAGLAHLKDCKNLTTLSLHETQVTDTGLAELAGLKLLTELNLAKTQVTAEGVEGLAKALPKCKITWNGGMIDPMASLAPDRRAAEYVLSIGGSVRVNGDEREIKAVTDLPRGLFRLTEISLTNNRQVTDTGLAVFKSCQNLRVAGLNRSKVSDAGLACFQNCRELTTLDVGSTRISDAGLVHFQGCQDLNYLELGRTQVTDAGLAFFRDSKGLKFLGLLDTHISDAGLAYLKDCKNLRLVGLCNTQVSDAGLAMFQNCSDLTLIDLNSTRVTNAGLVHLKNCKSLIFLNLAGLPVSDAGLVHFRDCTGLKTLSLSDTHISDEGLAHFKDCQNLTAVWLCGTKVSDAGLVRFKDCKHLAKLFLDNTQVTDAGLTELAGLELLTELDLAKSQVTAEGVEGLAKALPNCKITWNGGVIDPMASLAPDRRAAE